MQVLISSARSSAAFLTQYGSAKNGLCIGATSETRIKHQAPSIMSRIESINITINIKRPWSHNMTLLRCKPEASCYKPEASCYKLEASCYKPEAS